MLIVVLKRIDLCFSSKYLPQSKKNVTAGDMLVKIIINAIENSNGILLTRTGKS